MMPLFRLVLLLCLLVRPFACAMAAEENEGVPAQEAPLPEKRPMPVPQTRPDKPDRPQDDEKGESPSATPEPKPEAMKESPPDRPGIEEDPAVLTACLAALDDLGATYRKREPINGEGECGIRAPIAVSGIVPGVALEPEGLMRCRTALALARWTTDFVAPAARRLGPAVRLTAVEHASTYVCRRRNNARSGKISEHAFGNAIDVRSFRFSNRAPIPVEKRTRTGDLEEAFQRAVRGAACLEFSTVLGPGADEAHRDHLHLDVIERPSGYRLCE